jgi:hypothetical protein
MQPSNLTGCHVELVNVRPACRAKKTL